MLRILLVIFILIMISGGLIFWRLSANKNNLTSPNVELVDSQPVEVPKTLPSDSLDQQVQTLEDAITTIVSEINNLKKGVSSIQSQSNVSLDDRLKTVEAGLTELKIKVSALEKATPQPATTNGSKSTLFIPLGAGGSWGDQDWKTLDEYQITLDPGSFPGYSGMVLEVNFRMNESAGAASVRLLNATDTSVASSEISTTSTTFAIHSSASFKLASGNKTYKLQIKSSQGKTVFVDFARIRVNF